MVRNFVIGTIGFVIGVYVVSKHPGWIAAVNPWKG